MGWLNDRIFCCNKSGIKVKLNWAVDVAVEGIWMKIISRSKTDRLPIFYKKKIVIY